MRWGYEVVHLCCPLLCGHPMDVLVAKPKPYCYPLWKMPAKSGMFLAVKYFSGRPCLPQLPKVIVAQHGIAMQSIHQCMQHRHTLQN